MTDPKAADQFKALGEASARALETVRAMGPQIEKLMRAWRASMEVTATRQREIRAARRYQETVTRKPDATEMAAIREAVTYPSSDRVREVASRIAREDRTLLDRLAEDDGPPETWKVKP